MIFLSHQHRDKEIVDPIAYALEATYGEDNVFYDTWSIKPGENIIQRMSEGLDRAKYFFYFVTGNSLKSEMVTLEWTSALKNRSKDMQFIAIRADEVNVPIVISALSYLDMAHNGIDVTLQQMREIISPEAKKRKDIPTFNNLEVYAYQEGENTCKFLLRAKRFFEPNGLFGLATTLNRYEAEFKANVNMFESNFYPPRATTRGGESTKKNVFTVNILDGIKKGFDVELVFEVKGSGLQKSSGIQLYHMKSQHHGEPLNVIQVPSRDHIPPLNVKEL